MKHMTVNGAVLSPWLLKAGLVGLLVFTFRRLKFTHKYLNRLETLVWSEASVGRPYGFSLKTSPELKEVDGKLNKPPVLDTQSCGRDQIEWSSLVDKSFFARHLPPRHITKAQLDDAETFPDIDAVSDLFRRPSITNDGESREVMTKGRGNLLFMSFAQWLTDGVLRSSYTDRRKTDSSHQIDLAQIYGGSELETKLLREKDGGKLKLDSNGYFPLLFNKDGEHDYSGMSYVETEINQSISQISNSIDSNDPGAINLSDYKKSLRATGLKTGTLSVGNLMLSTLFAREHNRVCDELLKVYPSLTSDQTFHYARNITTVRALQIILKDYIGFITGKDHYSLDPKLAKSMKSSGGWIPIEFNLLYRWHSAIPGKFSISNDKELDWRTGVSEFENYGLDRLIQEAATKNCGDISLKNTPSFLIPAEQNMIQMSRFWKLGSYADYCRAFQMPVAKSFYELTEDIEVANMLNKLYGYGKVENLEFVVGIFAEKKYSDCLFGKLLMRMVAYDAFNHIYSNPILAPNNFTEKSFTKIGLEWLNQSFSLDDLIRNNTDLKCSPLNFNFECSPSHHPNKCGSEESINEVNASHIEQTLCPVLRVGTKAGEFKLDEHGWASSQALKNYMTNIGFKKGSLIIHFIVSLAEKATKSSGPSGRVQLTGFRGTFQDHGSSSRIQHGPGRVNNERLQDLLDNASTDGIFSQAELAKATLMFHQNASKNGGKPSVFGAVFQLLEMGSVLRIFGKKIDGKRGYVLTKDELLSIWQENEYPKNSCPHTEKRRAYGTFETVSIHISMLYYYIAAWGKQKSGY